MVMMQVPKGAAAIWIRRARGHNCTRRITEYQLAVQDAMTIAAASYMVIRYVLSWYIHNTIQCIIVAKIVEDRGRLRRHDQGEPWWNRAERPRPLWEKVVGQRASRTTRKRREVEVERCVTTNSVDSVTWLRTDSTDLTFR